MSNAGDTYLQNDLEVGGDLYASVKLFMEGTSGTGADGDQFIYFYNQNSRQGESIHWYDFGGPFEISAPLEVDGYVRTADDYYYETPQVSYQSLSPAAFDGPYGNYAVDGFGYGIKTVQTAGSVPLSANVQLPHGATVTELRCSALDSDSGTNFSLFVQMIRARTNAGSTNDNVQMAGISAPLVGRFSSNIFTTTDSTINSAVIDNASYTYILDGTWTFDDVPSSGTRFYGCRIKYEVTTVAK